MGSLVLAWLFGEGLIAWRSVSRDHMPPSPRQLFLASGLFAGLAVVAEYQPARGVAALFAWAVDLAVLIQVLPGSGTQAEIKKGTSGGWASIGLAGNSVIIPDGTAASTAEASLTSASSVQSQSVNTSGAGAGGTAGANQQVAQQVISSNGQFAGWGTGGQWDCLVKLWNQESGWSATADNPSSGAYGIAQALPASKYPPAAQQSGGSSPSAQIGWGLSYILATYGSPCAAWAHEQQNNWY